ncbi:unnamed protein product [Closterium sp. NIES-54]
MSSTVEKDFVAYMPVLHPFPVGRCLTLSCRFPVHAAAATVATYSTKIILKDLALALISTAGNREEWVCLLEGCEKGKGSSFEQAVHHALSQRHRGGLTKPGAATRALKDKLSLCVLKKDGFSDLLPQPVDAMGLLRAHHVDVATAATAALAATALAAALVPAAAPVAAAPVVAATAVAAAVAVAASGVAAAPAVAAAPVAAAAATAEPAAASTTGPCASKVLSVGAAATTSLVPSFVADSGATSPTAQLSFTLDSGASSCFFRDCTDLTPLHTPVTVALAEPSVGSVVAHSTTVLPCPAAPSGFLTGYYTPSFSRKLVGVSHLHDLGVVTTFQLDKPVSSCTVGAIGVPLATFHREPGSGLYSLRAGSHHTGSGQFRSGQVAAVSCDCRSLTHPSVLWHHRLGHPLFPRLSRMVRHRLVSCLLDLLAPLPRLPAPPCTPCVEGRPCTSPHSSSFPPTTAPFQTLHLDVWGPSPIRGPRQERYFLIVVDDYSRYTMVLPLRRKAGVPTVLEPWLLARGDAQALCGLCLHLDHGGEFSSTRLETFCQGRGIIQSYTLPDSPQKNGVSERRIGLVMEVARTSMCHAGAPQFLWPQAVRYAAHQLNLWPSDARQRVTPVSLWTGSPGVADDYRVWGSLAHVCAPVANKLSPRTRACVFLGFPLDTFGWQFYDPVTCQFFSSQDVTFDELDSYYRSRPHRGSEAFSPPLFLTLEPPPVAPVSPPPSRPALSGVSHVTPQSSPPQRPVPVASGGAGGAVAEIEGTGAAGAHGAGFGGARGVREEATPEEDTAVSTQRPRPASPPGFPPVPQFPPRSPLRPVAAELGGVPAGGIGVHEGVVRGGSGYGGAGAGDTSTATPMPCTVRFLTCVQRLDKLEREEQERLGGHDTSSSTSTSTSSNSSTSIEQESRLQQQVQLQPQQERVEQESRPQQQVQLQPQLERVEQESRPQQQVQLQPQQERVEQKSRPQPQVQLRPQLERVEQESRPPQQVLQQQSPEEAGQQRLRDLPDSAPARFVCGPLPSPLVPPAESISSSQWTRRSPLSRAVSPKPRRSRYRADGPFHLVLCSHVPPPPVLPQPPESSLTVFHDPLSDYLRASRPVVSRVLSALVTHPTAPALSVSALVTTVSAFASSHRLDYAAHLVSGTACSPSYGGAPVFPLEVLEDRQFELGFLAAAVPHLCAMLLAPEGDPDALDISTPRTHAEAVSGPWASYWIAGEEAGMASYRSTGTYVDAVLPPGANIVSGMWLYKGSLHEQIWLRRVPDFTGTFPPEIQWQLCRLVYSLRQAPREWHDTLRTTLASLHFFPTSADPSLFVRRGSTPFFVLVYVDNVRYLGLQITKDRAARTIMLTQLHMVKQILTRFHFPFSKVQPTPLAMDHGLTAPPSDKAFESSGPYPELVGFCIYEADVYAAAMAAKELRWLSFLLTDLREWPRSPSVLFADNRPAILLCEEPRLVGKAKHIQLRYFLLREFQQRGQARVVRVVSEANTADIFTKALPPWDHQRFCTQLGLVSTGPHLLA